MQLVCFCIDGVKAPFENISIVLHFFREKETDEKLKQLRTVLQKLPTENYINLRYVRVSSLNVLYPPQTINAHSHTSYALCVYL